MRTLGRLRGVQNADVSDAGKTWFVLVLARLQTRAEMDNSPAS
jgi:hypothetical protein